MAEKLSCFQHHDLSNYAHIQDNIESPVEVQKMEIGLIPESESTTSLHMLLTTIKHERNRDESDLKLISSDGS